MTRQKLLGSWRAERWEWIRLPTSEVLFATDNVHGLLIYTAEGMMSAQLARTRGAHSLGTLRARGIALELKRWLIEAPGFEFAYAGRFEVDEARERVVHHVELRSWLAPRQRQLERRYRLQGDQLCLEFGDATVRDRLYWRRA